MQIRELRGYRDDPIHKKARELFTKDAIGGTYGHKRSVQLSQFTKFLGEFGFNKLGSGQFGAVYEKPGYPWVFKLFTDDPAYKRYIKYVIQNQDNPHVPKVKGNIIRINPHTFAVRMEKLQPVNINSATNEVELLYRLSRTDYAAHLRRSDIRWLEEHYPRILDILNALSRNRGDRLDIDTNNLMLRGNVPVLVDPVIAFGK